jgi:preprotein translocase subunit SecG
MKNILNLIQIVISSLLITTIIIQSRGSGLSSIFGGGGEIFQTRRGIEKSLFIATIVLAIIFLAVGILRLVIAK